MGPALFLSNPSRPKPCRGPLPFFFRPSSQQPSFARPKRGPALGSPGPLHPGPLRLPFGPAPHAPSRAGQLASAQVASPRLTARPHLAAQASPLARSPLSRSQQAPPLTRGPSLPASASPSRSYRRASRRRSRAAPFTVRIPRIPAGPFNCPCGLPAPPSAAANPSRLSPRSVRAEHGTAVATRRLAARPGPLRHRIRRRSSALVPVVSPRPPSTASTPARTDFAPETAPAGKRISRQLPPPATSAAP